MFKLPPLQRISLAQGERAALLGELQDAVKAPLVTEALEPYSGDESGAPCVLPDAVVFPATTEEVAAVLRIASAHGVPVTPRGAGTGKSGGCVPVRGGLVLSTAQLNRTLAVNREDNSAVVQPGVILAELQRLAANERRFYPPDPASAEWCTMGGTVAENAAGPNTLKYGTTRDYVLGLEAVLMDGTVIRTGRGTSKGVVGYDLTSLLVGSEGTLAVLTELTVELVAAPQATYTAFMGFVSVAAAARAVTAMMDAGLRASALELLDSQALLAVREDVLALVGAQTNAAIIVELDGFAPDSAEALSELERAAALSGAESCFVAADSAQRARIWQARKRVSQALRQRYAHKVSEDICVPRSRIAEMIARVAAIASPLGLAYATYGHAGDGNLHTNLLWNDPASAANVDVALGAVYAAAVQLGGTLSGEHGVGLVKREFVPLELSSESMSLQRRLKQLFDPRGLLNPDKLFPAERDALLGGRP